MNLKKRFLFIIILGGIIMTGLSACGLNKNSREWIEKNRVSDIYKVYPTKNPEDLFKVFPDGFDIVQHYTTPQGVLYQLELEGDAKTKEIKGQFIKEPYADDKTQKLSNVGVQNGQVVFSDETVKKDWPIDGFLFQHLTLNQAYCEGLKEKKHTYNSNSGVFEINYQLKDSKVNKLLKKEDQRITDFEITGSGKNYHIRTLTFTFNDTSEFSESINKPYN
ncbi:hypothetical protein [Streptococcus macacae]|uniref:Lipoprotein n=1 Tax=Streptococcus macacae NCTC 11558 TaxID=764298 RepID=G5JWV8_9STRE|nr:hypothetical protein [Streptococcus macacae]EHJ52951.1 hypothetical protein STRMA_1255 [Streptococcus macacae NCTC 11558]SUN79134.1 lipoprotein [Streptococcus macacae NCTC 11558]